MNLAEALGFKFEDQTPERQEKLAVNRVDRRPLHEIQEAIRQKDLRKTREDILEKAAKVREKEAKKLKIEPNNSKKRKPAEEPSGPAFKM